MAKQAQRKRSARRRALRRRFVVGGIVSATTAFCLLMLRKLVRERKPVTAPQFAMASSEAQQPTNPKTAFEATDWALTPVAVIYVGILLLLAISCVAIIVAYPAAVGDVSRTLHINPPGPRLQTDPEADLAKFRAEEERRLNTYYWVDRQKGTVHVPIEEAMRKLVQTGIPGFSKGQP